jgi:hypothetical protein
VENMKPVGDRAALDLPPCPVSVLHLSFGAKGSVSPRAYSGRPFPARTGLIVLPHLRPEATGEAAVSRWPVAARRLEPSPAIAACSFDCHGLNHTPAWG